MAESGYLHRVIEATLRKIRDQLGFGIDIRHLVVLLIRNCFTTIHKKRWTENFNIGERLEIPMGPADETCE